MKNRIQQLWEENPLKLILIIALAIRIVAAFFSKGYAFHDDHFSVIRVAQDWAHGIPHWFERISPPHHSMLYAGVHAIIIKVLEFLGIFDPEVKMIFVRLLHAFYSLLIVYFGYKITDLLSGKKDARLVGMLMALLWFMPYMGVKNLAEMVCVPPVLAAFYILVKNKGQETWLHWLLVGGLFALSFTLRLHAVIFAGGLGMVMLYEKRWKAAILFSLGFAIVAFLIQGVIDIVYFNYPFESVLTYFGYNIDTAYGIITGPFYRYIFTVAGFMVPPISLFLLYGFIKGRKVSPMIFVSALVFFIIHSTFPHKQERFILPFFPFFTIIAVIGWNQFLVHSKFWGRNQKLYRGFWSFFWILNVIAGIGLSLTYSKKDRIAPLYYIYKQGDVKSVIVDYGGSSKHPPAYYMGKPSTVYDDMFNPVTGEINLSSGLRQFIEEKGYLDENFPVIFTKRGDEDVSVLRARMDKVQKQPNYVIVKGKNDFEKRLEALKTLFPGQSLIQEKVIEPSNYDLLLHFFNPRIHKKRTATIYKVE